MNRNGEPHLPVVSLSVAEQLYKTFANIDFFPGFGPSKGMNIDYNNHCIKMLPKCQ